MHNHSYRAVLFDIPETSSRAPVFVAGNLHDSLLEHEVSGGNHLYSLDIDRSESLDQLKFLSSVQQQ